MQATALSYDPRRQFLQYARILRCFGRGACICRFHQCDYSQLSDYSAAQVFSIWAVRIVSQAFWTHLPISLSNSINSLSTGFCRLGRLLYTGDLNFVDGNSRWSVFTGLLTTRISLLWINLVRGCPTWMDTSSFGVRPVCEGGFFQPENVVMIAVIVATRESRRETWALPRSGHIDTGSDCKDRSTFSVVITAIVWKTAFSIQCKVDPCYML